MLRYHLGQRTLPIIVEKDFVSTEEHENQNCFSDGEGMNLLRDSVTAIFLSPLSVFLLLHGYATKSLI